MTTTQLTKLAIDVWLSGNNQFGISQTKEMLAWAGGEVRLRLRLDNTEAYGLHCGETDAINDGYVNEVHAVVMGLITALRAGLVQPSQFDKMVQASF